MQDVIRCSDESIQRWGHRIQTWAWKDGAKIIKRKYCVAEEKWVIIAFTGGYFKLNGREGEIKRERARRKIWKMHKSFISQARSLQREKRRDTERQRRVRVSPPLMKINRPCYGFGVCLISMTHILTEISSWCYGWEFLPPYKMSEAPMVPNYTRAN